MGEILVMSVLLNERAASCVTFPGRSCPQGERQVPVYYYRAWYRRMRDEGPLDSQFPEWVVYAEGEDEAEAKVLQVLNRPDPERGYRIILTRIEDEDEGTVAFATAQQSGQAIL